jgi:hypothetical protein
LEDIVIGGRIILKIFLKERGQKGVNMIHLAQDRDKLGNSFSDGETAPHPVAIIQPIN